MESPIFIFSLPRSGSTLLQRVLMTDPNICSVAEPWLLLPQLYSLKKEGVVSEFSSLTAQQAIGDFIDNLPNKQIDYNISLNSFISDLYSKQCKNNERYFLDKTPRYYLIINEIAEVFPNAKFIFLFRNPLHIFASIIETWGNKSISKIHRNSRDLTEGFNALSNGYKIHKERSISVNYEDFVNYPEIELKKISNYLDLKIDSEVLKDFSKQDTKGELGDPTGAKRYKSISKEGLDKWKNTLNASFRKKIVINLFKKIDDISFSLQGYDKQDIIKDLKAIDNRNNKYIVKDFFDYNKSRLISMLKLNLMLRKEYLWFRKRFIS
ncbi:sulfotransferase family protein [Mesoflavibacter zeaxanthinifaciens]|uniref:sulfotransferase family protein n=1 Tax=Mesoflavibacter zeaxanthinifaciens TaxID=393060 RepID=UPI003A8F3E2B